MTPAPRFDLAAQADVTEADLEAFQGTWGLPVLRAGGSGVGRGGLARVAPLLDALVGWLWERDQVAAGVAPEGQEPPPT